MVSDWEQKDKEALYDWLQSILRNGNVKLKFRKKDDTIRKMVATLKEDVIPKYEKKTDKDKKVNKEVMSVFDVEKQEWRSFRLDSIIEIKGTLQ